MKRLFIGIDVSKGHADFAFLDENQHKVIKNSKLFDNADGHIALVNTLRAFKKQYPEVAIYCAMESTGRYEKHWNNVLNKFNDIVDKVFVISGFSIKHYHKSLHEKNKTDSISSYVIAHYLSTNFCKLTANNPADFNPNRRIVKAIDLIDKSIVVTTNQLLAEVYAYFPEFISVVENNFSKWKLDYLKKYPTSYHAKHGKIKAMRKIRYSSNSALKSIKLEVNKAIRSLGSKEENDRDGKLIRDLAKSILELRKKKQNLFSDLVESLNSRDIELLKSIPGVGTNLAVQMLAIIGDIKRFDSAKKLASYFGVHPILRNSGNINKGVMKKSANPYSRKILYNIAFQMCKEGAPLNYIFSRFAEQMGNKMKAIGKCMHLLSRVIWAILTNQQEFNIEKFKRQHTRIGAKDEHVINEFTELLTFANNTVVAPISAKKKKELNERIQENKDKKESPKSVKAPRYQVPI